MSFTYTIDNDNAVRVFKNGDDAPFWFQPDYPNGDKFDTKEEAEAWAVLAVESMQDDKPFPPSGKGVTGEAKPTTPAEIPAHLRH